MRAAVASLGTAAQAPIIVARPSGKKPVRSRRLPPEPHEDPEDLGLHAHYYPPWQLAEDAAVDQALFLLHGRAHAPLPAAYAPLSPQQEDASLFRSDGEQEQQQRGRYLQSPEEARLLLLAGAWRDVGVWRLLGLNAGYADDFFRGPDYRCAFFARSRLLRALCGPVRVPPDCGGPARPP